MSYITVKAKQAKNLLESDPVWQHCFTKLYMLEESKFLNI